MEDRGTAAYAAEFIGTFVLVVAITLAASNYAIEPTDALPNPFVDFSVIGTVHTFALFILIQGLALASGAHFNPAVTTAMLALKQIKVSTAAVYVLAQLAGAVLAALVTKLLLTDFPNAEAVNYGAPAISDRLDGSTALGMLGEGLGTFFLVFTIVAVAVNPEAPKAWAGLAIGASLGLAVFCIGPLTGGSFNPARAFGPALVSGEFGGAGTFLLAYVLAPILGGLLAAVGYFNLYIAPGKKGAGGMEPVG